MKLAIILMLFSFVADQIIQPKAIRNHKHKNTSTLMLHVLVWTMVMIPFPVILVIYTGSDNLYLWLPISAIAHFAIEWCCLRTWTHYFYDKNKSMVAFWIILEQLLINSFMIFTLEYFLSHGG